MEQPPLIPFVLPWDDASDGVTNVSSWIEKPAGAKGFVVAKDAHLFAGEKRIRFFGVNMAFGGNFPTHADADKIAARMAKFGINCVRFHHMDMFSGPGGIMAKDMVALDDGQLDKLDYFIAVLKKQGIYANINLHVSRAYPNVPKWENGASYFKGVDNFFPQMIEMQRDYARRLLTHVNPYTNLSYTDDPAVAFVEINNENGLICEWWGGALDNMPAAYEDELASRWNAFLGKKYKDEAALRTAWSVGEEPVGEQMLANADFAKGTDGWLVERHGGSAADVTTKDPEIDVNVTQPGGAAWHVQFSQPGLPVKKGASYTVTLRAKASQKASVRMSIAQAHEPWEHLAGVDLSLTTEWQDFSFVMTTSKDEPNARLAFSGMGGAKRTYSFADISMKPGGRSGLAKDVKYGAIALFTKSQWGSRTPAAATDWMTFLWETETDYWTSMQAFLKQDLGVKSLVVGSATGFSPSTIQAKLDVVDGHSYWQHPNFPGRSWDAGNWTVNNVSMAGNGNGGAMPHIATRRVADKPYIVTEYNAASPNTYSSEAFLILAAYAALQDWDGIFPFAYSHRTDDWRSGKISGFFDVDTHPTKMATFPATAAMFLRGDVATTNEWLVADVSPAQAIDHGTRSGPWWNTETLGIPARAMLSQPIAIRLSDAPKRFDGSNITGIDKDKPVISKTGEVTWDNAGKSMTLVSPRSRTFVGKLPGGSINLGDVKVEFDRNRQDWATLSLTAIDGADLKSAGRVLVTATGYAENTDMGWKNDQKTTVGRDWGKTPSLVEGIGASLHFSVANDGLKAWALDERGQRREPVEVKSDTTGTAINIGSQYKTIWYEIEIK